MKSGQQRQRRKQRQFVAELKGKGKGPSRIARDAGLTKKQAKRAMRRDERE